MNYQKITNVDIANGIGCRVTLWISGCEHHCNGCHNECTWKFDSGEHFGEEELSKLLSMLSPDYIDGLTLSGGDPLAEKNRFFTHYIAYRVKETHPNKSIWCYTGYTYEEVSDLPIMNLIDVLVDGKFEKELYDIALRFRGSSNQRIIDVKKSISEGKVVDWVDEPVFQHGK